METGTKTLITSFVIAITILLTSGIWSCGKRIASTEKHYIKNDSLTISNHYELTQNATFSDIGSIKPFDALKPMIIDGKWYFNTVIEFDKSIKKGIEVKAGENLSYTSSESSETSKQTEKTDNSNLWIGLTFVIGTLFVIYLTLKKYKIL
jgi:hypothetical protein